MKERITSNQNSVSACHDTHTDCSCTTPKATQYTIRIPVTTTCTCAHEQYLHTVLTLCASTAVETQRVRTTCSNHPWVWIDNLYWDRCRVLKVGLLIFSGYQLLYFPNIKSTTNSEEVSLSFAVGCGRSTSRSVILDTLCRRTCPNSSLVSRKRTTVCDWQAWWW